MLLIFGDDWLNFRQLPHLMKGSGSALAPGLNNAGRYGPKGTTQSQSSSD
jgi:hypothetical protein